MPRIYVYIYIYVCVCVCIHIYMCVCANKILIENWDFYKLVQLGLLCRMRRKGSGRCKTRRGNRRKRISNSRACQNCVSDTRAGTAIIFCLKLALFFRGELWNVFTNLCLELSVV